MNNQTEADFTLVNAIKSYKEGRAHQWVMNYLMGPGKNQALAKILEKEQQTEVILIEYPINKLFRVMGPVGEDGLLFWEPAVIWENRVEHLIKLLKDDTPLPPLIASDIWGYQSVADGAHRYEALKRLDRRKYWIFFYVKDPELKKKILQEATE